MAISRKPLFFLVQRCPKRAQIQLQTPVKTFPRIVQISEMFFSRHISLKNDVCGWEKTYWVQKTRFPQRVEKSFKCKINMLVVVELQMLAFGIGWNRRCTWAVVMDSKIYFWCNDVRIAVRLNWMSSNVSNAFNFRKSVSSLYPLKSFHQVALNRWFILYSFWFSFCMSAAVRKCYHNGGFFFGERGKRIEGKVNFLSLSLSFFFDFLAVSSSPPNWTHNGGFFWREGEKNWREGFPPV